jgi:hypothetical protein
LKKAINLISFNRIAPIELIIGLPILCLKLAKAIISELANSILNIKLVKKKYVPGITRDFKKPSDQLYRKLQYSSSTIQLSYLILKIMFPFSSTG